MGEFQLLVGRKSEIFQTIFFFNFVTSFYTKMVQNAAEEKADIRSVNAEQGCSNTVLRIVGNSNKVVYLTALRFITFFIAPLRTKLMLLNM